MSYITKDMLFGSEEDIGEYFRSEKAYAGILHRGYCVVSNNHKFGNFLVCTVLPNRFAFIIAFFILAMICMPRGISKLIVYLCGVRILYCYYGAFFWSVWQQLELMTFGTPVWFLGTSYSSDEFFIAWCPASVYVPIMVLGCVDIFCKYYHLYCELMHMTPEAAELLILSHRIK